MRKARSIVVVVGIATIIAAAVVGVPGRASAQVPVPALPPAPAEVQPALDAVSPLIFQACLSQTIPTGIAQAAQGLAPVPVQLQMVTGSVTGLVVFDLACGYFVPSVVPPSCGLDETILESAAVTIVSLPAPASVIAAEILAIEKSLNALGAPVGSQLSDPVVTQLGCS